MIRGSKQYKNNGTVNSCERRHRLNAEEIPEVLEALKLRLWYHLEYRQSLSDASTIFRAYYRIATHCMGRPEYPEPITWGLIEIAIGAPPYEMVPLIKEVLA